jgi:hypothetical protein
MTTLGRLPVLDLSVRRRSLLLGGVGGAAALATLGHSGTAAAQPPQLPDLDTGNAIDFLATSTANAAPGQSPAAESFNVADPFPALWLGHMESVAWFDAVAPYHPTAVGVYTRIGRRPASESATNRNLNIAIFHAQYQMVKGTFPEVAPLIGQLLTLLGLDPDDESEDPTSPVGIGNLAGKGTVAAGVRDGMNILGDEGGRQYNRKPYADYTGPRPVNTAYELVNPSRWQPLLTPHRRRLGAGIGDKGIFTVQHFQTPQMRLVKPHSYEDPRQFRLAPPDFSDHHRRGAYKRSVDEVLEASAALTDEQKVKAEVFDNKTFLGVGSTPLAAASHHPEQSVHDWAQMFLTALTAILDVGIAVWHYKTVYEAVRPVSAIAHVYGSRPVTAWGGVGMGTVNDIPADEWASYLGTGNHPEYPSATASLYAAQAQSLRRFFGDDVLGWRLPAAAGSTLVEAGITPANDIEVSWPTWTDLVNDARDGRVWGGVHFRKTQERSIAFGEQFGDLAYEFAQRHIDGDVED